MQRTIMLHSHLTGTPDNFHLFVNWSREVWVAHAADIRRGGTGGARGNYHRWTNLGSVNGAPQEMAQTFQRMQRAPRLIGQNENPLAARSQRV